MRKLALMTSVSAAFMIAGCSEAQDAASSDYAVDAEIVTEASADASGGTPVTSLPAPADLTGKEGASQAGSNQSPVINAPQIAYAYDYGFRIDADAISDLAQSHVALCEKMGPKQCRVISLRQSGSEGSYATGALELAVAAGKARNFGKDLGAAAQGLGGEQINVSISGEDLSKSIIDTQARLRARSLLRDRLMEVLRSRTGTVAELVEAERGVAQVNEEIDQAQSWLAEMKGRVAFSSVSIDYNSSARSGGSFVRPIVEAFGSIGTTLGLAIAALIYTLTFLLPIVLLIFGLRWILHRFGMRMRFWKRDDTVMERAETGGTP